MSVMMENSIRLLSALYICFLLAEGQALECYQCDDVLSPGDCTHRKLCGQDSECSAIYQPYGLLQEYRYKLGCTHVRVCDMLKALPSDSTNCYECCTKDRCNNHLCHSKNTSHTATPTTLTTQTTTTPTTHSTTTPTTTTINYHFAPTVSLNHVVTGHIGSTVHVTCHFSGNPTPTIEWKFNHGGLPSNVKHHHVHQGDVLAIKDATLSNSGRYTCIAENLMGHASEYASVVITGEKPAFIQRPPSHLHLTEGQSAVLVCRASGNPQPNITWDFHLNHLSLQGLTAFVESSDHTKITIYNAITEMSGQVKCTATNILGSVTSTTSLVVEEVTTTSTTRTTTTTTSPTTVHVHSTPQPITVSVPSSINVMYGESTSVTCTATGDPTPTVTWSQFPDHFASNVYQFGNDLSITSAKPFNSRLFMCEASNKHGNSIKTVQVTVIGVKPSFVKIPQNQTVQANGAIIMQCEADGQPPPEVTWTWTPTLNQPAVTMEGLKSIPSVVFRNNNTELVIDPVYSIHHGIYGCIASNIYGSVTEYAYLSVSPHAANSAPTVAVSNELVTSLYGNDVNIQYDVSGSPKPSVTWLFKNSVISQSNVNVTGNHLVISRASEKNEGMYSCIAHNTMGTDRVDVSVNIIGQKPVFIRKPETSTALFGTSSSLHCTATGIPTPSITWTYISASGSKNLPSGVTYNADKTTLTISSPHESAIFTCKAHNYYGETSAHASLFVRTSGVIG